MECNKCHDLLSDLLDNTLTGDDRRLLDAHFQECMSCTGVHDELDRIIALAREGREEYAAPIDGQALWLRIREHVEGDIEWAREARFATRAAAANSSLRLGHAQGESWWSRLWNARWELSAPQVTGAFAALVGVAVLATAFGTSVLRSPQGIALSTDGGQSFVSNRVTESSAGDAAERINFDEYVRHQQSNIEYWRQRVEENKNRLPPRMLESFERTMVSLDQDVSYSLNELRHNPHDKVSEQMLNRALQDKVEILQELSSEF